MSDKGIQTIVVDAYLVDSIWPYLRTSIDKFLAPCINIGRSTSEDGMHWFWYHLWCQKVKHIDVKVTYVWICDVKVWWVKSNWHFPCHLSASTFLLSDSRNEASSVSSASEQSMEGKCIGVCIKCPHHSINERATELAERRGCNDGYAEHRQLWSPSLRASLTLRSGEFWCQ